MRRGRTKPISAILTALLIAVPSVAQSDSPKPRTWQDDGDYPADAVAKSKTGVTTVQFDVTEKGRAENCTIIETSGSGKLDGQSCALVLRMARVTPAKDEQGRAIRSVQTRKIDWRKMAN